MKLISLLIVPLVIIVSCQTPVKELTRNFAIDDAETIAQSLIPVQDHKNQNTKAYIEGKLKIISADGWLIVGVDTEGPDSYETKFWVQNPSPDTLNLEMINGQILYAGSCFIINNTEKNERYFCSLGFDNNQVVRIWNKLPQKLMASLQGKSIIGVGIGSGSDDVNSFDQYFD
jgi:hypothetical protein